MFGWLRDQGNVEELEMLRTFNCGTGMVVITSADSADAVTQCLTDQGETVTRLGEITAANGEVEFKGQINWS